LNGTGVDGQCAFLDQHALSGLHVARAAVGDDLHRAAHHRDVEYQSGATIVERNARLAARGQADRRGRSIDLQRADGTRLPEHHQASAEQANEARAVDVEAGLRVHVQRRPVTEQNFGAALFGTDAITLHEREVWQARLGTRLAIDGNAAFSDRDVRRSSDLCVRHGRRTD
jgi:hypothetical protein